LGLFELSFTRSPAFLQASVVVDGHGHHRRRARFGVEVRRVLDGFGWSAGVLDGGLERAQGRAAPGLAFVPEAAGATEEGQHARHFRLNAAGRERTPHVDAAKLKLPPTARVR